MIRQGRTVAHRVAHSLEFHTAEIVTYSGTTALHGAHREVRPNATLRPCEVDRLLALASAVGRLSPGHRDPEAFHIGKSEIMAELRRLARVLA